MSMMPPHRCTRCGALVPGGHCTACRRQRPSPSAQGYNSKAWRSFRLLQLSLNPFCAACGMLANTFVTRHIPDVVTEHFKRLCARQGKPYTSALAQRAGFDSRARGGIRHP